MLNQNLLNAMSEKFQQQNKNETENKMELVEMFINKELFFVCRFFSHPHI